VRKPPLRFKVPANVAQLVRGLHPDIKRKCALHLIGLRATPKPEKHCKAISTACAACR
jgi:hypothetical protein